MIWWKSLIKQQALKRGIVIDRAMPESEVKGFVDRFKDNYATIDLVRIGGDGDGGHLLPNNLKSVKYCFSAGLDCAANFESQLSKGYSIKSFMADGSAKAPALKDDNFNFIPKFLGTGTGGDFITLADWLAESLGGDSSGKILQMDIAGKEWDVLAYESADLLSQFSSMIIRFHVLENMFEKHFFRMASIIFEKIYSNFSICHISPDNYFDIAKLNGSDIPKAIELTFIRNDLIEQFYSEQKAAMEKAISVDEYKNFALRFQKKYEAIELIRIGGDGDGGYLLPNNLKSVKYCFSAGVDVVANFESQLSKDYSIKSFMADASVKAPPLEDDNFSFIPKFLGAKTEGDFITLSDWIAESLGDDSSGKILQMDIEGSEYEVLAYESADLLSQFSVIIIEFHGLENIFQRDFFQRLTAIFEKIYSNFSICHVHPNNCGGVANLNGIDIPKVIEVTFIRNDLVEQFRSSSNVLLPHSLDSTNCPSVPDITMPEIWWKRDRP